MGKLLLGFFLLMLTIAACSHYFLPSTMTVYKYAWFNNFADKNGSCNFYRIKTADFGLSLRLIGYSEYTNHFIANLTVSFFNKI